jgi:hypothetical protein
MHVSFYDDKYPTSFLDCERIEYVAALERREGCES